MDIFTQISLLVVMAAVIAIIMRILRQPLMIGYILTGILVGPSVLNVVKSHDAISAFANIGIALLLFIIGLGLNPKVLHELGKVATITGIFQVTITAALGYGLAVAFHFPAMAALAIGICLSFSSTIIILKLLSDKKENTRLFAKLTIGLLLAQDIIAAIVLLISSGGHDGFSVDRILWLAVKGLALAVFLVLANLQILPRFQKIIASNQELLFLFAIGWGFGIATLAEHLGLSLEIGALIAGISLATLPYSQEISTRLRPLRDFFIIVFFIQLGSGLALGHLNGVWWPVIILSLAVIVLKPVIVMSILGLLGYTKRTSFKAALTNSQISEFSLVFIVLLANNGSVSGRVVSVITLVAIITIAISSYLITYSDGIYVALQDHLRLFESSRANFEQETAAQTYDIVQFGYNRGGAELLKVFKSIKGKKTVVVDYNPEVIDILERRKVHYIYGDASDLELLDEIGIERAKIIVSSISDFDTNKFLITQLEARNTRAVIIARADSAEEATQLYALGASYVTVPHYVGAEKLSSFLKRHGFKKEEFERYRKNHLVKLQGHYALEHELE
jgi:Kef-type K+ transport system membrane component KefB